MIKYLELNNFRGTALIQPKPISRYANYTKNLAAYLEQGIDPALMLMDESAFEPIVQKQLLAILSLGSMATLLSPTGEVVQYRTELPIPSASDIFENRLMGNTDHALRNGVRHNLAAITKCGDFAFREIDAKERLARYFLGSAATSLACMDTELQWREMPFWEEVEELEMVISREVDNVKRMTEAVSKRLGYVPTIGMLSAPTELELAFVSSFSPRAAKAIAKG